MMWAGQLSGEALNLALKHAIKQERPSCAQNLDECLPKKLTMGQTARPMAMDFRRRTANTWDILLPF
jgi:hypothetical protein